MDSNRDGGRGSIRIRGARQHNLKNLDLDIRTGEDDGGDGASSSGKSGLMLRRCMPRGSGASQTFSACARQFSYAHGPPGGRSVSTACRRPSRSDQTNPVRSSRSTVGTTTRLERPLKLLLRAPPGCSTARPRSACATDSPETIDAELMARTRGRSAPS